MSAQVASRTDTVSGPPEMGAQSGTACGLGNDRAYVPPAGDDIARCSVRRNDLTAAAPVETCLAGVAGYLEETSSSLTCASWVLSARAYGPSPYVRMVSVAHPYSFLSDLFSRFQSGAQRAPSAADAARILERLESLGVRVHARQRVLAYLQDDEEMGPVAIRAAQAARAEFAKDAELHLDLRVDPETAETYLRLCVRAPAYDEEFVRRLQQLCWATTDLSTAKGFLVLTSDFA